MTEYIIPVGARIGHVHLKVSNLERSLDFYCGVLGFEKVIVVDQAAFLSAGGYHHHIGLNTWFSKGEEPAPEQSPGLFHAAILYPLRQDLAAILRRLQAVGYPLTGASDHGVSEALYLEDPDQNGIELYWDRPRDEWPRDDHGRLTMYTRRLDLAELLQSSI